MTRRNIFIAATSLLLVIGLWLWRVITDSETRPIKDVSQDQIAPKPVAGHNDSGYQDDGFELPFLGKIKGPVHAETLQLESETGGTLQVPFKVFYSAEGVFLHARYERPGSNDGRPADPTNRLDLRSQSTRNSR